eukprot:COSAG06_NODE_14117_length_1188_cov_1.147842_1_plen_328_part_00
MVASPFQQRRRPAALALLVLLLPPHGQQQAEARISGFHVDFEQCSGQLSPGGGGQEAQQKVCGVFLDGLANISAEMRLQSAGLRYNLQLSVDAGTWMACDPAQSPCTKIVHAGVNKSVLEHVVDIADRIQIMDYDVTVDKVLGRATRFLDYAESINKRSCITIGLAVAPFPDPHPVWYTLPNETALLELMGELRPILEKRPSFAGFAVFDGVMWQDNSARIGADNSIAVNRSAWPGWLSWAKTRRITAAYVAPHAGTPWLFPVPGIGGSAEDAAAFCEFVGTADAAGIDLELYVDGWPGQGRPSWNIFGYEFVHNCTVLLRKAQASR